MHDGLLESNYLRSIVKKIPVRPDQYIESIDIKLGEETGSLKLSDDHVSVMAQLLFPEKGSKSWLPVHKGTLYLSGIYWEEARSLEKLFQQMKTSHVGGVKHLAMSHSWGQLKSEHGYRVRE